MRNISCLAGVRELGNINKYAMSALTEEERRFIENINAIVKGFRAGKSDKFITLKEIIDVQILWGRYGHLQPFQFRFDPRTKIPQVFNNQTAFIIWAAWGARHLLGEDDDLKGGSLAAAKILSKHQPPFSAEVRKTVVREFQKQKGGFWETEKNELCFWNKHIFPYLEGTWEFKWEPAEENN